MASNVTRDQQPCQAVYLWKSVFAGAKSENPARRETPKAKTKKKKIQKKKKNLGGRRKTRKKNRRRKGQRGGAPTPRAPSRKTEEKTCLWMRQSKPRARLEGEIRQVRRAEKTEAGVQRGTSSPDFFPRAASVAPRRAPRLSLPRQWLLPRSLSKTGRSPVSTGLLR